MSLEDALVILADHHNRSYWWDLRSNPVWVDAARMVRERADEIVQREWERQPLPPFDHVKR